MWTRGRWLDQQVFCWATREFGTSTQQKSPVVKVVAVQRGMESYRTLSPAGSRGHTPQNPQKCMFMAVVSGISARLPVS